MRRSRSMRRRLDSCTIGLAATLVLVAMLIPGAAVARAASDDFLPALAHTALVSARNGGAIANQRFTISAQVVWNGAQNAAGEVKITVTLPAGISWAGPAAGPGQGCTRSAEQATCAAKVSPGQGTNLAAAFGIGTVVAQSPGTYTFSAAITETSAPDPNPSNNTTSMQVAVGRTPAGGVKLKPPRPMAGVTVVAAMSVWSRTDQETFPLDTGSVSCTAVIGKAKLPARGALSAGRATCTMKTPKTAKGKTLKGTMTASAGGAQLTRSFSTRVG